MLRADKHVLWFGAGGFGPGNEFLESGFVIGQMLGIRPPHLGGVDGRVECVFGDVNSNVMRIMHIFVCALWLTAVLNHRLKLLSDTRGLLF